MEIIVLDIETTGFGYRKDAIVEIGMTLVNTVTKEINIIFDKVVKDSNFDKRKHKDAWIFQNSTLTLEDVLKAKSIEFYREDIQGLLNKYPMTAFNMPFDTGFMKAREFKLRETKCLMKTCREYNRNLDKSGRIKMPTVPEIYEQFFINEEKYVEKHRGADDAYHEGKILLRLVELKERKKKAPID